jgi:hypothetical protein
MKLYKYMPPHLWESVLGDRLVRFTQPDDLNDPFEMKPFYKSFLAAQEIFSELSPSEYDKALLKIQSEWLDQIKALVPVSSIPNLDEAWALIVERVPAVLDPCLPSVTDVFSTMINRHIGVLCLTERPDDPVMWSHYAQSHRGFVIQLDSEHAFFNQRRSDADEFGYLRKVRYDERPSTVLTNVDSADVFCVKGKDWEYEKEWRMLRPLRDCDKMIPKDGLPICLFTIPADCITGVICGNKMDDQTRGAIVALLSRGDYGHVRTYHVELGQRVYGLTIVEDDGAGSACG